MWHKHETSDSSESQLLPLHCGLAEIDIFSQPVLVYCNTHYYIAHIGPQRAAGNSDVTQV
jgi:hypothetical protein